MLIFFSTFFNLIVHIDIIASGFKNLNFIKAYIRSMRNLLRWYRRRARWKIKISWDQSLEKGKRAILYRSSNKNCQIKLLLEGKSFVLDDESYFSISKSEMNGNDIYYYSDKQSSPPSKKYKFKKKFE